jgi:ketosteroid isomerase-like protein
MSEQNVELVRRSFEAFARGDFETAFSSYNSNVEWLTAADEPDRRTYCGAAGLRKFATAAAEPWADRFQSVMDFEDFIDCGDWVVAPWTATFRGRGSGIAIDVCETWAARVEGTEIVRVEEYRTKEEALAAVARQAKHSAATGDRGPTRASRRSR